MHVVRSVYMSCRYIQTVVQYRTVLPSTVCAALRLHGRCAASVGVLYIFNIFTPVHYTVIYYNNSASLRLRASNATSASTPQEYSVMYSV